MLSVVIPTRDKAVSLKATLIGLAAQRYSAPHEVVVVDDGEGDGEDTENVLRSVAREPVPFTLRVVRGSRRGRAAARNTGALAARGRILLFVDDDLLTTRTHLAAHARECGPRVFAHGPVLELPGARRWLEGTGSVAFAEFADRIERVVTRKEGRLMSTSLERLVSGMADGSVPEVAPWAAFVGANTSVSRTAFEEASGFDEGFGRDWGCEDLELGIRLVEAGVRPCLVKGAAAVHLTHARPGRWKEHERTLKRLRSLHDLPAVRALPALLHERGKVEDYVRACAAEADPGKAQ